MRNKKKVVAIVAVAIFVASLLVWLSYSGSRKKTAVKAGVATTAKAPAPDHQHAGGPPVPLERTTGTAGDAAEPEETPLVEIPMDKQEMIGVKTVQAVVKPLERALRTVGRIEYDERRLATANTKIEGWIEKLHVDYTGRYVKKGEPLAEIYSPELVATQQEFLNTIRWVSQGKAVKDEQTGMLLTKDAEVILAAAKERLRLWDISEEQIARVAQTGKPRRTLTIYSPVSGYVVQKMAVQGMRVMPGEKLFDVADLASVWVIADIYEYELPLIKIGQRARISLSYFPGRESFAQVDYVYPALAGETRTAKVRFTIPNPDGELKPQMFTNVEIKINLGNRLAVPTDAVIDTGVRQIVYVDKGEGNFEPREVKTGLRTEDLVEIVRGLKTGEKVAAAANFLIDSEAQLKGVTPLPLKK